MTPTLQRVVAILVLLVAGILSLSLAASVLNRSDTENWIIPVHLLLMAVIGTGVTLAVPAMAREDTPTAMRALTGMGWGILTALTGMLAVWLLLNGFHGA